MTFNIANLIEEAVASSEAEVPEGYLRTASMDIVPEIGRVFEAVIVSVEERKTAKGFPRLMIRAQEKSFYDQNEVMYSFFDNLSFSDSPSANAITIQSLLKLGVTPDDLNSIGLTGFGPVCEKLEGKTYQVEVLDHVDGRDGRVFLNLSWTSVSDTVSIDE